MKVVLILISIVGLGLTLLPSFFVFAQTMGWETHLTLMTIGTVLWFVTAPLWMKKEDTI